MDREDQALHYIEQLLQQLKERNRSSQYFIALNTLYKPQRITQLGKFLFNFFFLFKIIYIKNKTKMILGLKSIMNIYPTLHLPAVDSSQITFSSLDWQTKGIKELCHQ